MKKILAQFNVVDFTEKKYDQVVNDLTAAGQGKPSGRLQHVVAQQAIGMLVSDVWESEEALNEFSKILIPILQKNGVTPAVPTILPVHNIIA